MMNKPPTTLAPLHRRGEQHIKVLIPNEENAKARIRQVTGRKWSKTHNCWYVPYTTDVYRQLQELFEVTVPPAFLKSAPSMPFPEPVPETRPGLPSETEAIRLEKDSRRRMKAFVPWQRKDRIEKIKTIPGRAWNQEGKYWSLPLPEQSSGTFGNGLANKPISPMDCLLTSRKIAAQHPTLKSQRRAAQMEMHMLSPIRKMKNKTEQTKI